MIERLEAWFDYILTFLLGIFLVLYYARLLYSLDEQLLLILALVGTLPVVISALTALKNRELSIDLLASIALVASLLAKEWPSAVFINLMLSSARIFERYTDNQARRAIQSLLKLRPEKVKIKKSDGVVEVGIEEVKIGDIILVETGERVPVDGAVIKGSASIDQSSLTGESIPVTKQINDQVLSSTLNVSGTIEIKAEKVGSDTTLSKIIKLVEASQSSKAGIHTIAESFTNWYIWLALLGAAAVYFWLRDLNFVLALLLVACADDIAVAVPLAFLAAIGAAAKQGVIIKGGEFLEGLTKVKTIMLDKTGTLTSSKLSVHAVVPFDDMKPEELISLAAVVECFSDHPAAKAITEYAASQKVFCREPQDFNEIPGMGSSALNDGHRIMAGKLDYLQKQKVQISEHQLNDINLAKDKGLNTTLISRDGILVGFISLADQLRPEAASSIHDLKALGISKLVMLTGDNEAVASKVSSELGITDYHANLLPEDKLKYIKSELNDKYKVAMVGDGVNDAASLALTDIGIAMGAIGSDAAIEAADIALMKDDFSKIPAVIRLGQYTMRIAAQDFWIWGITNAVGFALVIGHFIGPSGAAAYNFLTDFLPFFNSLRLFRLHKTKVF